MRILLKVEVVKHGRFAGVHSYSFDDELEDAPLKIRLCCQSGQMDIDAEDLHALDKAIQLFKLGENI